MNKSGQRSEGGDGATKRSRGVKAPILQREPKDAL